MHTDASRPRARSWLHANWHRALAHAAGLMPLVWLAVDYARHGNTFTFNRMVMLSTGSASLALLVASFACSPVSRLLRWPALTQVRRALGLYAFVYAGLHVWNYAVLESGLEPALIVRDLQERPAMFLGLVALLALVPMAATSTRGWQQRLGKGWRRLHRLVYVAVPFSVWHYLWLDRDIITVPVVYSVVVAALLALRVPAVRGALRRLLGLAAGARRRG